MAGDQSHEAGPDRLDPDEHDLLAGYRALPPEDRRALRRIIDSMNGLVMPSTQVRGRQLLSGNGDA